MQNQLRDIKEPTDYISNSYLSIILLKKFSSTEIALASNEKWIKYISFSPRYSAYYIECILHVFFQAPAQIN